MLAYLSLPPECRYWVMRALVMVPPVGWGFWKREPVDSHNTPMPAVLGLAPGCCRWDRTSADGLALDDGPTHGLGLGRGHGLGRCGLVDERLLASGHRLGDGLRLGLVLRGLGLGR